MSGEAAALLTLGGAVVGSHMWVRRSRAKRRTRTNKSRAVLAAGRGWSFLPEDPTLLDRWLDFHASSGRCAETRARKQRTFGVLRGTIGRWPFTVWSYERLVPRHHGRGSLGVLSTVWIVHLSARLPNADVRPARQSGQRLVARMNRPDVIVECEDFALASALCSSDVVALTHALGERGWYIRGSDLIAVSGPGARDHASAEAVVETAELLVGLASTLPASVPRQE